MKIPALIPFAFFILHFSFLTFFNQNLLAQTTFVVTSTLDNPDNNVGDGICNDGLGNCTLRAAIQEANAVAGRDSVAFSIPGVSPHTFLPTTALPAITEDLILDASTDPSYTFGNPQIVIDGSLIANGATCFNLQPGADDCVIRGFCIGGFTTGTSGGGYGLHIFSNNNIVEQNFIGLNVDGLTPFPNAQDGIIITAAANNNLIGGNLATNANVISGNTGAGISLTLGFNNNIQGNLIGTDKSGSIAVPNNFGIFIISLSPSNHLIGSTNIARRNIISGNTTYGIQAPGGSTFDILGNYIGTDSTGLNAVPNGEYGIFLGGGGSVENVNIGGVANGAGNLISGNDSTGIRLQGLNNLVAGNRIGTQADGTTPLPNGACGIHIEGQNNVIGSIAANIIAYHPLEGIRVETSSFPALKNMISQNSIYNNGTLGIDLGYNSAAQGATANDVDDGDSGPNLLQNFANLFVPAYNTNTNILNLTYSVPSDPANVNYPLTVEFFIADANGQGRTYIGSDIYTVTDYNNGPDKAISFTPLFPLIIGENLANTVTAVDSNTSEFNSETILPLTSTFLTAKLEGDKTYLNWNSLPKSFHTYELQRAGIANQFHHIQTFTFGLPAIGAYTDLKPQSGINRYRLKINHADGNVAYSNIVSVFVHKMAKTPTFYPNPVNEQLFVQLPTYPSKGVDLQIIDARGRIIQRHHFEKVDMELMIPTANLAKGVYLLRYRDESQVDWHTSKLMVY